mmetsp:Transcript_21266/g.46276  ORF Transcript_21266/g.46276 Transcript_21266/m.46276 type:complete len:304 (+) Transcript_21266:114-1025(+)
MCEIVDVAEEVEPDGHLGAIVFVVAQLVDVLDKRGVRDKPLDVEVGGDLEHADDAAAEETGGEDEHGGFAGGGEDESRQVIPHNADSNGRFGGVCACGGEAGAAAALDVLVLGGVATAAVGAAFLLSPKIEDDHGHEQRHLQNKVEEYPDPGVETEVAQRRQHRGGTRQEGDEVGDRGHENRRTSAGNGLADAIAGGGGGVCGVHCGHDDKGVVDADAEHDERQRVGDEREREGRGGHEPEGGGEGETDAEGGADGEPGGGVDPLAAGEDEAGEENEEHVAQHGQNAVLGERSRDLLSDKAVE